MYVIGSDNDNQDNNCTKPSSSITVTYHLNNQELNRRRRGDERRDPGPGLCVAPYLCQSTFGLLIVQFHEMICEKETLFLSKI